MASTTQGGLLPNDRAPQASTLEIPIADEIVRRPGYRRAQYRCEVATSLAGLEPHIAAWEDLERRSLDDNFYLSPPVLAATLRHFGDRHPYYVVFVYKSDDRGDRLVACAPFSLTPATLRVPVATLETLVSPYSYLSDPLLDRDHAPSALSAIWDWIEQPGQPWRLVVLRQVSVRSRAWPLTLAELDRRGCEHWVKESTPRAVLKRSWSFETYVEQWSASRRKGYRRKLRRLEALGEVEVVAHRRLGQAPDLAQRFMDLEAKGWKGENGTAMALDPSSSAFFSDITDASSAQGRLFFVELKLDGRSIAMTSNYILGHTMFAFKIAHDPQFEKFSPGTLVEIETIRMFHETPELLVGDGGTSGGSYLDSYWRDQTLMQVVYVSTSHFASELCIRAIPAATYAKRVVSKGLARLRGSHVSESIDS